MDVNALTYNELGKLSFKDDDTDKVKLYEICTKLFQKNPYFPIARSDVEGKYENIYSFEILGGTTIKFKALEGNKLFTGETKLTYERTSS
ncbi:hypothetical protein SLITO_v1c07050 [Spiroplasma litorale]|uniref:Uncharacterized protein n=1 Tax=Spiroplasma litorale TaxID=216942 RepID=A0A0K1W1Y9_9MOLU|nr:hypothetical protein [Spiroplasma litorale]AKX34330.1 hypothetical protein SLITO_v1c07050 [Spiroplasma litorale]